MKVTKQTNEFYQDFKTVYAHAYDSEFDPEPIVEITIVNNAVVTDDFKKFVKKYEGVLQDMAKTGGDSMLIRQNNLFDYQKFILENYQIGSWHKTKGAEYYDPDQNIPFEEYLSTPKVEEETIRVSNRWNYDDCDTIEPVINHVWAVGRYHKGKYEIVKRFKDDRMYY